MSRLVTVMFASAALSLVSSAAVAQVDAKKAEATAKEAGCLACHAVSGKKKAPPLKDISKKFKGESDKIFAAAKSNKEHGDELKDVSDGDIKLVASWIATL
jgi:cytochrome c551/c552